MTFLNQTLQKRHSVAHGMTLDNVATSLELHDIVDKIRVLELSFAMLLKNTFQEQVGIKGGRKVAIFKQQISRIGNIGLAALTESTTEIIMRLL